MTETKTFVEACLAGDCDLDAIDDYVDRWHDGGTGLMLWEYLGMTRSEYGRWVADADKLEAILAARGFAQPVHGAAGA